MEKNIDANGYLNILGSTIRLAIFDFKVAHKYIDSLERKRKAISKIKPNKRILLTPQKERIIELVHNYTTAKHFLFASTGVEWLINYCNLPLDITYIRRIALDDSAPIYLSMKNKKKTDEELYD